MCLAPAGLEKKFVGAAVRSGESLRLETHLPTWLVGCILPAAVAAPAAFARGSGTVWGPELWGAIEYRRCVVAFGSAPSCFWPATRRRGGAMLVPLYSLRRAVILYLLHVTCGVVVVEIDQLVVLLMLLSV